MARAFYPHTLGVCALLAALLVRAGVCVGDALDGSLEVQSAYVNVDNGAALRVYERLGFGRIGRRARYRRT